MANVITYEEYCNALGISFDPEHPINEPDWFRTTQRKALKIIYKCIPQSHLVPTSRMMLADLKCRFLPDVIEGISEQIKFMKDNDITFENGWLNSDTSFGVGQYTQGPMNKFNIERAFRALCPASYDIFDSLGWTYANVNDRLKTSDYYMMSTEWWKCQDNDQ